MALDSSRVRGPTIDNASVRQRMLCIPQRRIFSTTMNRAFPKQGRKRLASEPYRSLRQEILRRNGWRCKRCGGRCDLQIHHVELRSHLGNDGEQNLITLCENCHGLVDRKR
jgi:5-methylcytosine-specific restriction endonuclease McrA